MEVCYKCKQLYPLEELYHMSKDKNKRRYKCKPCDRARMSVKYLRKNPKSLAQISRYDERGIAKCRYCGNTEDNIEFEVDHLIPQSKGGINAIENYQYICRMCNRAKSDYSHGEFLNYIRILVENYKY